jgi:protein-S-isoprenylcysteine O-methyltransferase Ste14
MNSSLPSTTKLLWMAAWRLTAGVVFVGLLLFLPAGTFSYWQAWLYISQLFLPVAVVCTIILVRDPELLERRMRTREQQPAQRTVVLVSSIALILLLVIPGLDRRYGWSSVPSLIVLVADAAILAGYGVFALTLRENRFASRVVEVASKQVVIRTGPYALVRHPMYLAISIMFALSPLALGSWWGLVPSIVFPLTLIGRIQNEEQLLRRELPGYGDYCRQVRHRLVPFVW